MTGLILVGSWKLVCKSSPSNRYLVEKKRRGLNAAQRNLGNRRFLVWFLATILSLSNRLIEGDIMETYSSFRPTGFDSHIEINRDDEESREDWLVVPVSHNRDSECFAESNFAVALEMLGGESETVEVHRFSHWGPGWFELILVKPDTLAEAIAYEIEGKLADYPLLDEDDCSEREHIAAQETWENCYNTTERLKYIRDHRYQFDFSSLADMMGCVRGKFFCGYDRELIQP
jgi:hypothetical protein